MTPDEVKALQTEIEAYAHKFGLDFTPIQYEVVDYDTMNRVCAYDGFPVRYPHWRFGMEYDRQSKTFGYGLSRVYELILNTDPCVAYLLSSNLISDQRMVMAHCCGHAHMFKNNFWFAGTNRDMINEMANHALRISRYIERHGLEKVEQFIDYCLSIDNLIDVHAPAIIRNETIIETDELEAFQAARITAKDYMDEFINPPAYIEQQKKKEEADKKARKEKFPLTPERDIMKFLLDHAPLETWQQDILDIVREEAYYFVPQRQTKILNEGFATWSHSHIMTGYAVKPEDLIDYADHHAGVIAPHKRVNPYRIGWKLLKHIEDRWDRGAFGKEYDDCEDMEERKHWDKKLGLGKQKVLEVARVYNDMGFIDEFLTPEIATDDKLISFDHDDQSASFSESFEAVKKSFLFQLTNCGSPIMEVTDGNFNNTGELLITHRETGVQLNVEYANGTMAGLYAIWKRPIIVQSGDEIMIYDKEGFNYKQKKQPTTWGVEF